MSPAQDQTEHEVEHAACVPPTLPPETPKRTAMPTPTLRTPGENWPAHRIRGSAPRRVPNMNFRIIPLSLRNTAAPPTVSNDEEPIHVTTESTDEMTAETSAGLTLPDTEATSVDDPGTLPGSFEAPSPQPTMRSPLQSIAALRSARESKQRYRQRGLTPRKVSAANSLQPWTLRDLITDIPAPVFPLGDLALEEPEDAVRTDLLLEPFVGSEAPPPSAEPTMLDMDDRSAGSAAAETSADVPRLQGPHAAMNPDDKTTLHTMQPGFRPISEAERQRRERRFFRDRGTPRKVQNTGFKIQPMARPSKSSADIDKGNVAEQEG